MRGLAASLIGLLGPGCQEPTPSTWQPPGGGVPKGCIEEAVFDGPMAPRIGLSSHLESGDSATAAAYRAFEVASWQEMGVGTVRTDFVWAAIEPEQGVLDFSGTDRVVAAAEEAGTDLLGVLAYGNAWAASNGEVQGPPDDPATFASFAGATASRYAGRVAAWEVWNEPNVGLVFWQPEEDPKGYAVLLEETSLSIRGADPGAVVVFAGLFGPKLLNTSGPEFLRAVGAETDVASQVDAVGYHPYRYPFSAPETSSATQVSLQDEICDIRSLLGEIGAPDLPVWITELGWHTAADAIAAGVTPEEQASYLVRGALLSLAQGAERFVWYTFRDSGDDPLDQEEHFGLYGFDADPLTEPEAAAKPAATAFSVLTKALADHDRIIDRSEPWGLGGDTYGYEVTGGRDTVVALWTVSEVKTIEVPDGGTPSAEVRRIDGTSFEVSASSGRFSVDVGPSPVFLAYGGS